MIVKIYGEKPYKIALIHGGPGGAGYMHSVAKQLSKNIGVLEPWQSELSVQGQIDELKHQISKHAPIILLGSSWGAMLSLLFTAQNQDMVKKIILVGCGTFTKKGSEKVNEIRNSRLTDIQKEKLKKFKNEINFANEKTQNEIMKEFAGLYDITDSYNAKNNKELSNPSWNIFKNVWQDFIKLRDKKNYIKSEFIKIKTPVKLIQGDYDPHPIEEVSSFLKNCIPNIEVYELEKCGHYPWLEKYASDKFYQIINNEIM